MSNEAKIADLKRTIEIVDNNIAMHRSREQKYMAAAKAEKDSTTKAYDHRFELITELQTLGATYP